MPVDLNNFVSGARSIAGTASRSLGTVVNTVNTLKTEGFGAALRSVNLIPGGETGKNFNPAAALFKSSASRDWRVRLTFPPNIAFLTSPILAPLLETGGLVFPYTPSIQITHSAAYQPMTPVHNNYPFLSYENSKVDSMQITAPFYIEDSVEAAYWIAAVHFLKSVTKMQFGTDAAAGAPPPVLKLNGYGDYMFKNVPVVVTTFQIEMPNDVDYISTGIGANPNDKSSLVKSAAAAIASTVGLNLQGAKASQSIAWAPVKSQMTISVTPLYSREQVRNFSLDKFVKGDYIVKGGGFI